MKKMSKSIVAFLLILVLMVGVFPYSASAADNIHVYVAHTFWGDGTTANYTYQLNDGSHEAKIGGLSLHYVQETGQIAYCVEPDIGSNSKPTEYTEQDNATLWNIFSSFQRSAIRIVLAYGAPNGMSSTDQTTEWGYEGATQVFLWEIIMGLRDPNSFVRTDDSLYNKILSFCGSAAEKTAYQDAYATLDAKCKAHGKIPSFAYRSESLANANPVVMDYNPATGMCSKTLVDTNKIIPTDFLFTPPQGVTMKMDGNTVTFTCNYNEFVNKDIPAMKAVGRDFDTDNIAVTFFGYVGNTETNQRQTVCTTGKPDPVPVYLKLKLPDKPEITTSASFSTGDKLYLPLKQISILDTISYKNLAVGTEYRASGVLVDTSGNPIQVDGKNVTAEKTFTPESPNGEVQIVFVLDASSLAGKSVVAYEKVYLASGGLVASHEDPNDQNQTVSFLSPNITTSATFFDQTKNSHKTSSTTIIDTVAYSGLIPGKSYTVSGKLMFRGTDGTAHEVMVDGKPITASTTFTAEQADGTVSLSYTFDATKVAPNSVTVYEILYFGTSLLASHENINDKEQTVYFSNPAIATSATFDNGGKSYHKTDSVSIIDTVSYSNIKPGETYTVSGVLKYRNADGEAESVLNHGVEVTASETFTPTESSGTVKLTYTFDATSLTTNDITVFETLYLGTDVLATHHDINDQNQTVHFISPSIGTTATFEGGEKTSHKVHDVTIVDVVEYSNLVDGEKYILKGALMTKDEEGNAVPLMIEGEEVTATTSFVAPREHGSATIRFTFDAAGLETDTIVVYESLFIGDTLLAVHQDIDDEGQTVTFVTPNVQTEALFDDGLKISDPLSSVTIVDTVSCENLLVGQNYILEGTLMVETVDEEGETKYVPYEDEDGVLTSVECFTAEDVTASVEMSFTIDASELMGKHIVVFETLYATEEVNNPEGGLLLVPDVVLAEHMDLEDEAQTVEFSVPEIKTVAVFSDNDSHTYVLETVKKDDRCLH